VVERECRSVVLVYRSVIWNTNTGFLLLVFRKDGSEWKKRYRKGHKSLGDQEPFMEEETGKPWVVISLVKEQWRRYSFTVPE